MKKVKVAVIGYGHLGKWHCQKVEAHKDVAEFVAIVEKFPAGQKAAKANHPNVKVVSDLAEIIHEIEAAFVITPTSTHFELVKYLIENKKHIFCEKPLCSNDDEAKILKQMALDNKCLIQVGHSERFHQAWEMWRDHFQNLTPPFSVRINRVAPFKGRATDVDVVQDLAIHDLDLLLYLFKQKPTEIRAQGYKMRTKNWDHVSLDILLENGCDAKIVIGRNSVKEIRDLEVTSSQGQVMIDLFANKILEASPSQFDDGTFVKESSYPKRDHLLLEHGHFYESILSNKPAIINLQDGVRAVHLVDISLRALSIQAPVKVNLG